MIPHDVCALLLRRREELAGVLPEHTTTRDEPVNLRPAVVMLRARDGVAKWIEAGVLTIRKAWGSRGIGADNERLNHATRSV